MVNIKTKIYYDWAVFTECEYPDPSSCISHQVHEMLDIHKKFGGFPDTYKFENTIIRQRWWESTEIDFEDFANQLNMEVITVSSIQQPAGCVVPWHRDTFFKIKKQYPERKDKLVRALIMLKDWDMGHFLQADDEVIHHWSAGDAFIWSEEILHLGANVGFRPKFTLQVSGYNSA